MIFSKSSKMASRGPKGCPERFRGSFGTIWDPQKPFLTNSEKSIFKIFFRFFEIFHIDFWPITTVC